MMNRPFYPFLKLFFTALAALVLAASIPALISCKSNNDKELHVIETLLAEAEQSSIEDNTRAIKRANMAYKRAKKLKKSNPKIYARTSQLLGKIGFSSFKQPFYTRELKSKEKISEVFISLKTNTIYAIFENNSVTKWLFDRSFPGTITTHLLSPNSNQIDHIMFKGKKADLLDQDGNPLAELKHNDRIISAAISSNGTRALTVSADGTAREWNLKRDILSEFSIRKKYQPNELYNKAFYQPKINRILLAYDRFVPFPPQLWNETRKTLRSLAGNDPIQRAVFFSNRDKILMLSTSDESHASLWDLSANKSNLIARLRHSDKVYFAEFSPSGRMALTAGRDNLAILWDIGNPANPKLIESLRHEAPVTIAVFSHCGMLIATVSGENSVTIWNRGKTNYYDPPMLSLSEHRGKITSIAISPQNTHILTVSNKKDIKLWKKGGGTLEATLNGHANFVNSAIFSETDAFILTASDDSKAILWDLKGRVRAEFTGHSGPVFSAVFSPNGDTILTFSGDKTARLWDLRGNLLATPDKDDLSHLAAVFLSNGQIRTISKSGLVKTWCTPESISNWVDNFLN